MKSSAYDIMFILAGVGGSDMHVYDKECGELNRALGDSVGGNFLCDDLPLYDTCDCLPPQ